MSKKPIIVFEGVEGSGKSHHIAKISKYFDTADIWWLLPLPSMPSKTIIGFLNITPN